MAYTEDDLNLLASVPQLIGSAIAASAGSGLFGTGKELFANANAVLDGLKSYPGNPLIKQLLPDPAGDRAAAVEKMKRTRDWTTARLRAKGVDNGEKLRALVIEDARAAAAVLASKASPSEAAEYKQWALSIAEKVASAATEGGFLGFGGERVSAAEKALIADVRNALGVAATA
ncbi:hypothetical protein G5V57_23175 [Nordella sp. HKS 07]|uniref:hypothetical protein n=1 Tax=Nordella sp. HKS 07 TaxID=2712222 RepID=UPI0013E1835F|nr:hypothetical protein [Nordella sp. HKS 07]QIG50374.1 hypothetical protein G5V57_23175 [Nordella sp. HKS 07]